MFLWCPRPSAGLEGAGRSSGNRGCGQFTKQTDGKGDRLLSADFPDSHQALILVPDQAPPASADLQGTGSPAPSTDVKVVRLTYNANIFDVRNIDEARRIILTDEGSTTDERWNSETPYLADAIHQTLHITPETVLIDYGCGIGRMAKELIQRHGCRVIGVDISNNMRALAPSYVQSSRFLACSPEMLDAMVARNFVADAAISIWVLQHCLKPAEDIERIHRALVPGGGLFVLNNLYRAVPTREQAWANDGLDIKALVRDRFSLEMEGKPSDEQTPPALRDIIFWAKFLKSR